MDNTTLITTSTSLEGYRIIKQLGLVRGITSQNYLGKVDMQEFIFCQFPFRCATPRTVAVAALKH